MRVYFYLEDEKSARKVLPYWLKILCPAYSEAGDINSLTDNSYCMQSGYGYPQMAGQRLSAVVSQICNADCVDMLVIVFDSEGDRFRLPAMKNAVDKAAGGLKCPIKYVLVDICFETWLLGNASMMSKNFMNQYSELYYHYDVSKDTPEKMRKIKWFSSSDAQFHFFYCNKLFMSKFYSRFGYNKALPPRHVTEKDYLDKLIERYKAGQLTSLGRFLKIADEMNCNVK